MDVLRRYVNKQHALNASHVVAPKYTYILNIDALALLDRSTFYDYVIIIVSFFFTA